MDKSLLQRHAEVCQTLGHAMRLEILGHLRDGEKRVSDLVELTGIAQANLSQHLALLRGRDLLATRREGTNIYYRIANPKIIRACERLREVLVEQAAEHAQVVGTYPPTRNCR